jgi:hypothetical protein
MCLNLKQILVSGITGGSVLLVVTFLADAITQVIAPYDMFAIGGMRAITDPVMILFFLYPFIFAIIVAIVWSCIRDSFSGTDRKKAVRYGGLLFLLIIIPNTWVIFSSMTYPLGFHISNILTGIIAYPILGYLNVRFNSG